MIRLIFTSLSVWLGLFVGAIVHFGGYNEKVFTQMYWISVGISTLTTVLVIQKLLDPLDKKLSDKIGKDDG
jgi:low affinity Fe/Cu permease